MFFNVVLLGYTCTPRSTVTQQKCYKRNAFMFCNALLTARFFDVIVDVIFDVIWRLSFHRSVPVGAEIHVRISALAAPIVHRSASVAKLLFAGRSAKIVRHTRTRGVGTNRPARGPKRFENFMTSSRISVPRGTIVSYWIFHKHLGNMQDATGNVGHHCRT